jgi:site-specific DNA-methyltransferase (adenine-specific)
MGTRIFNADILQYSRDYQGPLYHAALFDPPYHLTSITDRYGDDAAAGAKDVDGVYRRASRGFMGQQWDGGDVFFQPATWQAISNLLYPGAFIIAYAAARNAHRMAVAMEDAGLIIHPTLYVWLRGKGFPKATSIHLQLESRLCDRVQKCATCGHVRAIDSDGNTCPACEGFIFPAWTYKDDGVLMAKSPPFRSPEANTWYHHRYGMASMKPMAEPIILCQKPYSGDRPMDDILNSGAGALNIGAARINGDPWVWGTQTDITGGGFGSKRPSDGDVHAEQVEGGEEGRWPGNFVLAHTPDCKLSGYREAGSTVLSLTDFRMARSPSGVARGIRGRVWRRLTSFRSGSAWIAA